MSRMNRSRSEDGLSTLTTMMGAVIGAMIIGGFIAFWYNADNGAQTNAAHSRQETAAMTVLNRAGRDVSEARTLVKSRERDFVTEKVTATPTPGNPSGQSVTRTRYAVEPRTEKGRTTQVLVRQVDDNASASFNPDAPFTFDSEQILARDIVIDGDTPTTFTYRGAAGGTTDTPSEVGRVDFTYVASTKGGKVEVKSSASINNAIGGNGQRGGADGALDADEDQITIVAGETGVVDVLANDSWSGTPVVAVLPGHGMPGNVTVDAATGNVTITPSAGLTTPGVYTLTYRLTDGSGASATSTIRVSVQVPLDQPVIKWDDICTTDGVDQYTLPVRTGLIYLVSTNGGPYTETAPGAHDVTGEGTKISVGLRAVTDTPAPGYVIRSGQANPKYVLTVDETDTYTYDEMPCAIDAWASNGPDSQSDDSGTNTIVWSGGFLRYQRISGPAVPGQPDSGFVPGVTNMIEGTADHQVRLGSRYTYTVVKTRNRVEDTVSSRPNGLKIDLDNDQYPLVPAIAATGGATGQNTVTGLNTGGIVNDVDLRILQSYLDNNARVLLREQAYVENVTPAYADAANWGTEKVYFGVAQSTCRTARSSTARDCYSWGGGSTAGSLVGQPDVYSGNGIARAYQAPTARPAGVSSGTADAANCFAADGTRTVNSAIAAREDNNSYNCASGYSNVRWTSSNADHGMPADARFCSYPGNPGGCLVQAKRPERAAFESAYSPLPVFQDKWGQADTYAVRACNVGGCAVDAASTTLNAFAGPTSMNQINQPQDRRFMDLVTWYNPGCWELNSNCRPNSPSEARAAWSDSTGAESYRFQAQRNGGGPVEVDRSRSISNSDFFSVVPSRIYQMRAYAYPRNSDYWRRTATEAKGDASFIASPTHVSYIQDSPFCKQAEDSGWEYGFAFRAQAIGPDGADISNSVPQHARWMWWMKKMDAGSGDAIGVAAAPYWRGTAVYPGPLSGGPADWTLNMEPYRDFGDVPLDGRLVKGRPDILIPPLNNEGTRGGAAHLRIEVYTTKAEAGYPDFGDLRYWTGPGSTAEGLDVAGADIRVRAEDVTAAQVANCNGNGVAAHGFNGEGSAWYAVANGAKVTRRYALADAVPYRGTPRPGVDGYISWSAVQ